MSENMENKIIEQKKIKLKRMRFIATSILVFMALVYVIFKRVEDRGILFSSIVAFSEASMIGALADWFAVVALFRHPLGMSWIPHTAIIQKNKDKIGESLSGFVVTNFFTEDIIRSKLKGISLIEKIESYIHCNKRDLAIKAVDFLPAAAEAMYNNKKFHEVANTSIKAALKNIDAYSYLESLAGNYISSGMHAPFVKKILNMLRLWVSTNKDKTMNILEGINKTLTLPIVGDMVYKSIIKTLERLADEVESGAETEFNREVLKKLPAKIVDDIINSDEARLKFEQYKDNLLSTEGFNTFIDQKLIDIKDGLVTYSEDSNEKATEVVENLIESLLEGVLEDQLIREELENWASQGAVDMICSYREEIGDLIRETVDNWPVDDAVEKLETQVGGDLQYIRINGTIVGGLAGLVIHLISNLF